MIWSGTRQNITRTDP